MESIRTVRKQRDMTLSEVAEKTDLSVSFLSDLERGKTDPSLSTLRRLAACYGVKVASLLDEMGNVYLPAKEDPEAFEELLEPLHQAFLRVSAIMVEIGIHGKNYWNMLHAADELLEAMGHVENAAFEWRSYTGRHDEWIKEKEDEVREQQETPAYP